MQDCFLFLCLQIIDLGLYNNILREKVADLASKIIIIIGVAFAATSAQEKESEIR